MNSDRFRFFSSVYRESDLLVGVSRELSKGGLKLLEEMKVLVRNEQQRLYELISRHIKDFPEFSFSLEALPLPGKMLHLEPEILRMYECGLATSTGPMSAVAGLFAQYAGQAVGRVARKMQGLEASEGMEVLVENGGDLYTKNRKDLLVVVHAGDVALSGKIGLIIPPGEWGICTSSGTQGHSFSKGKADAVCIVCKSTPLADAWATSLANEIQNRQDIPPLLDRVATIPDILACVLIADGEVGMRGEFETKLLS